MKYLLSLILLSCSFTALSPQGDLAQSNAEESETRRLVHDILPQDRIHRITQSGNYILRDNLFYSGRHTAIEIDAHNVSLDLNGMSITLSHSGATGIVVNQTKNFTISNGTIRNHNNESVEGHAIFVNRAMGGTIENVITNRHVFGIKIASSHDVSVNNSEFRNSKTAAALVRGLFNEGDIGSTNIQFNNCIFRHAPNGLLVDGINNTDLKVINCQFPDASQTDLLIKSLSGFIIDGCTFTNLNANSSDDNYKQNLIQLGAVGDNNWVSAGVIKNCTVVNQNPYNGWLEGINLRQAFNVVVDSCMLSVSNWSDGIDEEIFPAAIHLGNFMYETYSFNCIVRNCVIGGFSLNGINLDSGYGNVAENNRISDTLLFGFYAWDEESSTIKGNIVNDIGYFSEYPGAAAYYLDGNTQGFIVEGNSANSNYSDGFDNYGTSNTFIKNTANWNDYTGFYENSITCSGYNVYIENMSINNNINYSDNIPAISNIGVTPATPGENLQPYYNNYNDCD